MLLPNKALEKPPSTNTNIKMLSYTLFGRELQNLGTKFILLEKETTVSFETSAIPVVVLRLGTTFILLEKKATMTFKTSAIPVVVLHLQDEF